MLIGGDVHSGGFVNLYNETECYSNTNCEPILSEIVTSPIANFPLKKSAEFNIVLASSHYFPYLTNELKLKLIGVNNK